MANPLIDQNEGTDSKMKFSTCFAFMTVYLRPVKVVLTHVINTYLGDIFYSCTNCFSKKKLTKKLMRLRPAFSLYGLVTTIFVAIFLHSNSTYWCQ